ncbi:glycosyltransferase family 4 protein [Methanofollis formosanus]|nr:glycosyltransferase family 4 protein [Methanofollis formosanus]
MRIGFFTEIFPYHCSLDENNIREANNARFSGGIGNVVYNLLLQMSKKGHEIYVFTTAAMGEETSVEKHENVTVVRYKPHFKVSSSPVVLDYLYSGFIFDLDLDIVHAHIGNPIASLGGALYTKRRRVPFVITYHEDMTGGYGGLLRRTAVWFLNTFVVDHILSQADVVITPSEYYIERSTHLKRIKEKVQSIPNGIILEDYQRKYSKRESRDILHLPQEEKIVLFVGSLTPRKAPDVLVKAMRLVLRDCPDSRLLFVGDGYYRNELETLAEEYGILDQIAFMGFVDDDTKKLCYSASDIFVLPSRSEGFGIVLLEASAYGLPLVVSDLEVFRSVVKDGYNGVFTEKENENDLASKIIYLIKNIDFRNDMGGYAGKKVQDFRWDSVADETLKLYIDVMRKI